MSHPGSVVLLLSFWAYVASLVDEVIFDLPLFGFWFLG